MNFRTHVKVNFYAAFGRQINQPGYHGSNILISGNNVTRTIHKPRQRPETMDINPNRHSRRMNDMKRRHQNQFFGRTTQQSTIPHNLGIKRLFTLAHWQ